MDAAARHTTAVERHRVNAETDYERAGGGPRDEANEMKSRSTDEAVGSTTAPHRRGRSTGADRPSVTIAAPLHCVSPQMA